MEKETPEEYQERMGGPEMEYLQHQTDFPEQHAPETPTECPDCKCTNLVSDQCKGECLCHHPELTPTEETVVHPKTNLIVDYLNNAMGVECDNADWTYINGILLSHDAELARKIEGMRKRKDIPRALRTFDGKVKSFRGYANDSDAYFNKALDTVLALLGKKNV
jgi:hypothetical protein